MSGEKFIMVTIGCAKNEIDTESIASVLLERGFVRTESLDEAEIAIVNTCAFIEPAKEESIDAALSLAALKREGRLSKLVIAGCFAQMHGGKLLEEIGEVDAVIGTGDWSAAGDVVAGLMAGSTKVVRVSAPGGSFGGRLREIKSGSLSSYLKISEGCDNRCSYCVIPSVRGSFKSRRMEDVLEEARVLAQAGVREISLISNDTGSYGVDLYGKTVLPELISGLDGIGGIEWIRFLYLHPSRISDEFLDAARSSSKVCRYLDIPVQHVSSRILARMKRRMTGPELTRMLRGIREKLPGTAIRTSVITGFPGETEEEFLELLSFINEFRFEHLGAFMYSREEGTEAALLPDQVDERTKQERLDRVMEAQMMISSENNESMIGRTVRVLIEEENGRYFLGRMSSQAPEVDGSVRVRKTGSTGRGFADVAIVGAEAYDLEGEVVSCRSNPEKGEG